MQNPNEESHAQVSDEDRVAFILEAVQHMRGQARHLMLDLITPTCMESATYALQLQPLEQPHRKQRGACMHAL